MKFRKKPVAIEAFQMTEARRMDNSEWPSWLHQAWNKNQGEEGALQRASMEATLPDVLEIVTREGKHRVSWGDWIVRGVHGELYPVKPEIFAVTYEPCVAGVDTLEARFRKSLALIIGSDDAKELSGMAGVLRAAPIPEHEKTAMIEAIQLLIDTAPKS